MKDLPHKIFAQIIRDLFDQPVISNLYRPHYVERMIALALVGGFELVSTDWSGWDIASCDGIRIEVKHSAAWQTWSDVAGAKPSSGVSDISARAGHWTGCGATWVPKAGRQTQLYISAWHPVKDPDAVDHRDPPQWLFYVVPTAALPAEQKTISQSVIAQRWPAKKFVELRRAVLRSLDSLSDAGE